MQVLPLLTLAILRWSGVADAALSTVVESGDEECFVFRPPTNEMSMISGNFDCLDDNLSSDPIGLTLYDSRMTPVWKSKKGASEGTFNLYGKGKHELCIQNGRLGNDDFYAPQDGIKREVGFSIRVDPQSRGMEDQAGPDDRLTYHLLELSGKMMSGLHTMADHQQYMREREAKHTLLADATFNRVVQWTALEAVVLMLIACGQVLYLRKFFEQRRYL